MFLGVNTSLSQGQICLYKDKDLIAESIWEKQGSHSEIITQEFSSLLSQTNKSAKELKKIFCVTGPGSFTGIRVGLNFCKTLAYSLRIPVSPINTLKLLQLNCSKSDLNQVSIIDAQKNSVFLSEFSQGETLIENEIYRIDSLHKVFTTPKYLCGNGLSRYLNFIDHSVKTNIISQEGWSKADLKNYFISELSEKETSLKWFQLQPLYIKNSAAEEKREPTPQQ